MRVRLVTCSRWLPTFLATIDAKSERIVELESLAVMLESDHFIESFHVENN